jgi:hypothetical protein
MKLAGALNQIVYFGSAQSFPRIQVGEVCVGVGSHCDQNLAHDVCSGCWRLRYFKRFETDWGSRPDAHNREVAGSAVDLNIA